MRMLLTALLLLCPSGSALADQTAVAPDATHRARRQLHGACAPPPETLWLMATYHKTGTQLNANIATDVASKSGGRVAYLNKDGDILTQKPTLTVGDGHGGQQIEKLEKAGEKTKQRICSTRIIVHGQGLRTTMSPGPSFNETCKSPGAPPWACVVTLARATAARFDAACGTTTSDVRAVVWLREPRALVLSAYFYHRTSHEKWLHVRNGREVKTWNNICRANKPAAQGPVADAKRHFQKVACTAPAARRALAAASAGKLTYAELLNALPPTAGALVEARRSMSGIVGMNATAAAATHRAPHFALHTVYLGSASDDFNATFEGVFTHLGVADAAMRAACVALACAHDLAHHPARASKQHVHQTKDDALRADLATFLAADQWYKLNVAPFAAFLRPNTNGRVTNGHPRHPS